MARRVFGGRVFCAGAVNNVAVTGATFQRIRLYGGRISLLHRASVARACERSARRCGTMSFLFMVVVVNSFGSAGAMLYFMARAA